MKSKYTDTLNALDDMQQTLLYRLRAPVLKKAEDTIVDLETKQHQIEQAIVEYYTALSSRKHAGVAMDTAFSKIEQILGMSWDSYKAKGWQGWQP